MTSTLKQHVFTALRKLLTPIVKMLLRNGVSYKEFCVLSKDLYVEVASADFGLRGRPTNVSRIALLTGLDRKEVKRIKDLLGKEQHGSDAQLNQDRFSRVLSAWHLDAEFIDDAGLPQELPSEGDTSSFASLAKRFGGDVPPQALIKELIRAGAVEELPNHQYRALQRYFFPVHTDPDAILRAGSVINELADTLFHNLYGSGANGKKIPRFERRASNNLIDPKHQKAFKAFVDKEGQAFLERVDDWLSAHEPSSDAPPTANKIRLGVGVYAIHKSQDNPEA
ncbi:MAG: hypothetical protein RL497_1796 [Pseudomonadota bacterium]